MQDRPDIEPVLTEGELRLGFSVQTLTYPQAGYELSGLSAVGGARLERAAALLLSDTLRMRRKMRGDGYQMERLEGDAWRAVGEFGTMDEIAESDAYRNRSQSVESLDAGSDID